MAAVKVGHPGQEAVYAVAVVVAPIGAELGGSGIVIAGHALGLVLHRGQFPARESLEDRQVFGTAEHAPVAGAVVGQVVVRGGRPLAEIGSASIAGARSGAADDFRLPVAVEVVDHEVHIVGSGADVAAQVDTPEEGSIQTVGVQQGGTGVAVLGVVARVAGLPLEDDLVATIAVQIAHRGIVGRISVSFSGGGAAAGGPLQGNGEVGLGPGADGGIAALLHAADDWTHGVLGPRRGGVIGVVRSPAQRSGVELERAAVDVEGDVRRVRAQQTPTDEIVGSAAYSHHPAIKGFHGIGRTKFRRQASAEPPSDTNNVND
jgi:hypothetical protein